MGDPALELFGAGFAGADDQVVEAGLVDDDSLSIISSWPFRMDFTNMKVHFFVIIQNT